MQKLSGIIGLACRVVTLGILLCKFLGEYYHLVGGATNYL